MKYILLIFLTISTLLGARYNFSNDYNKSLQQAKEEKKSIYVLVTSKTCPWCAKFERRVLKSRKTLKKLQKKYIVVHLLKGRDFIPTKFKTKRVPYHYFVDETGEITYSYLGYWNKKDFNLFLDEN